MSYGTKSDFRIREINRESEEEISLVVAGMRQTMIERMGEERGTAIYSMDWLKDRLLWHLDPQQTTAKVWVLEDAAAQVVAHAIARVERDEEAKAYGYFSTVFVAPEVRNRGLAKILLSQVESWFKDLNMPKIVYNTAANHEQLIRLFGRHGYTITHREDEMVQLTKSLAR